MSYYPTNLLQNSPNTPEIDGFAMFLTQEYLGRCISQTTSGSREELVIRFQVTSSAMTSALAICTVLRRSTQCLHSKIAQDKTRMRIFGAIQDILRLQVSVHDIVRVEIRDGFEDRSEVSDENCQRNKHE
jgi:hypothetical protein